MSTATEQTTGVGRLPYWLIPSTTLVSLVAGIVSELIIDANKRRFWTNEPGLPPFPPEFIRERMWNQIYNHIICYGALGAILCGLLGLVIGSAINSSRGIMGFVTGSLAGLVVGAGLGVVGHFVSESLQQATIEGMFKAIIIFTPLWIAICLAATLSTLVIIKRMDLLGKAVVMSICFGLLASILYPLFVSILHPLSWPGIIIPEHRAARLACCVLGSLCTATAVLLTLKKVIVPPADAEAATEDTSRSISELTIVRPILWVIGGLGLIAFVLQLVGVLPNTILPTSILFVCLIVVGVNAFLVGRRHGRLSQLAAAS